MKLFCFNCRKKHEFTLFGKSRPEADGTIRQHGVCNNCGIHQYPILDDRRSMLIKPTGIILLKEAE